MYTLGMDYGIDSGLVANDAFSLSKECLKTGIHL